MTASTFSPRLVGMTENTLRALMASFLAGTGLEYHSWILLSRVAVDGGDTDRDALTASAVDGLKIDKSTVDDVIEGLVQAGLLQTPPGRLRITERGRDLHQRISGPMLAASGTLYSDLSTQDLDATARVLTTIMRRANAILSR